MLYNTVLVSAVRQHESASGVCVCVYIYIYIYIYIYVPSLINLPLSSHPISPLYIVTEPP